MYEDNSVNTNNDFDQNTVIQPEKNHLLNLKEKNLPISKNTSQFYCCSEIDLKDAIGSTRREVLNKATSEINGIDIKSKKIYFTFVHKYRFILTNKIHF